MIKEIGKTFACEIPGCPLTFSSGSHSPGEINLVRTQANYHQQHEPHIGIVCLANFKRLNGQEPNPADNLLYFAVNLTLNGPVTLTAEPVSEFHARSLVALHKGDKAQEYFVSQGLDENG